MRKVRLWLAFVAALLATSAGAQSNLTVTAAEYFFDSDPGYGQATVINNVVGDELEIAISTSDLSVGAHSLCLRTLGSNGVWSTTMTKTIYVMHAGSNINSVEYFFDNDPGYGKGTVLALGGAKDVTLDINTVDITPGAHMLYLRTQDTNGNWSPVMAHSLYVFTVLPVAALEYFVDDNDPGEGKAISVPVATATAASAVFDIDTSELTPGEHTLNIRAMGIDSVWTAVSTRKFNVEGAVASEPEPYAVLDGTTLTFYYDDQKTARGGIDINTRSWDIENGEESPYGGITKAVFDASFANYQPVSTAYWFQGCRNMTTVEGMKYLNTSNVTSMWAMFDWCSSLESIDLSYMNTSNAVHLAYMFNGCSSLQSLNVSGFSTENATDIGAMFRYCSKLTTIDVSHFKTSKVTSFWGLFAECSSLTSLDVSNFDTGSAEDMAYMFYNCIQLQSLDLSHFNTQNVTNMYGMFGRCSGLTSLDVTGFNTAKVTDMSHMFYECSGLTSLDVTKFNTTNVKNMFGMFLSCSHLTSLDVSSFNTANVTNLGMMFLDCSGLTSLDVSNFNTANATNMYAMFSYCSNLTSLDLTKFNTANVTDMHSMFLGCYVLTSLDVSNFNTANVTDMSHMFYECVALKTIFAGSEWSTSSVTYSENMFGECTDLVGGKGTVFDANHIDAAYAHIDEGPSNPGYFTDKNATPAIAEAYAVLSDNNTVLTFYYDTEKQARGGIDINNDYIDKTVTSPYGTATKAIIDASFADYRPTSTGYWFQNCSSLTTITGMENLKTDNVTDMHYMFAGCSSLTSLDVKGFKTDNVMYMIGMFSGCSSLTTLDVSNFKTDNVLYMGDMFGNCSSLISLNLSGFKTDNVQDMNIYDMFDGCSSLAAIQAGNANIPAEGYARIGNPNLLVYVNEPSLVPQGVQNVVVNGLAKEIVLTDEVGSNDNNNFFVPQSFTAEKITYTRNFTQQTQPNVSRGWESISLPFSVQNIVHETKGALSPFGSSAEGKKFWLRRLADNGLTRVTQIVANVPYVISMPNSTEYTDLYNLAGRVTFSSQYTTVPATTQHVLALADSSIVMVPTTLRVNRSSSVWAINVGEVRGQYLEGSVFERDYREVRPFEAYTVHRSNGPAPRFVPISEMDSGATGIEDLTPSLSKGEGAWYDLNGSKLQQKPTQKGVYILNGTKVVIK